ncbi:DUF389 domain-containing protein [Herbidospora daliensis]|uniref:DUF389 domain-containing protein n=1 Tax=Herbidospora daliensis TaxID=295585 RepID=UPI000783B8B1|nr:DUF389 domain-containing protein [Herbidospora daliensis]
MLHIRVISPETVTDEVIGCLQEATGVTNLVVLSGAARHPAGDLVEFDVAREAANGVIESLRGFGIETSGSIAVEKIDLAISEAADRAREEAPGEGDDAVVWEELAARVADDSRMTWAFVVFLAIATQLAAIGVLLNSPILIVGAMVLGPEFGPIAAVCFGLMRREAGLIGAAVRNLVIGFAAAIVVTLACALVARGLGWIEPVMIAEGNTEEVNFIVKPDRWSFIVALLAGVAGVLSITAGKSSSLVGVFISVTTVPAAGYAAVAVALGEWGEVGHAALQLGVNILGMVIAGTLTLLAQRLLWGKYGESVGPRPRSDR